MRRYLKKGLMIAHICIAMITVQIAVICYFSVYSNATEESCFVLFWTGSCETAFGNRGQNKSCHHCDGPDENNERFCVFNSIEYYANIDDWTTNRYTAFEGSDGQVNATYASFLCYSLAECKDKCEPDDFENYKCVDQVFHQPYFVENDSIGGPNCEG